MIIDNRVGEPDLSLIPKHLKPGKLPPELYELIEFGYSIDRQGLPRTLQAVADSFNKLHSLAKKDRVKPDQIVMADGARAAASVAATYIKQKCAKILHPRALLLKPGYNLYNNQFSDLGFKLDEVFLPQNLGDAEKLKLIRAKITPDTIVLPITNPNNPTGEIYSEKFLRGLLKLADDFPNLHLISDSVYDRITRKNIPVPKNIYAIANTEERRRVFEVNGLAKSFAYPAIRVGWVITDEETAAEIQEIKDPMLGPLNNIAQLVAIAALEYTPELIPNYHAKANASYDARLALVHKKLHGIEGFAGKVPEGAFYYWADFSGVKKITVRKIIDELAGRKIYLAPGQKFGAPNCIRINCGASAEALTRICDAIVKLCK